MARRPGDRAIHSHRDATASEPSALSVLTPREQQVLALIGAGGSNAEIAQTLHLGVTTVKTHVAAITEKLGLRNGIQAAVTAQRWGLVDATFHPVDGPR